MRRTWQSPMAAALGRLPADFRPISTRFLPRMARHRIHRRFISIAIVQGRRQFSGAHSEVAMKTPLLMVLGAAVLLAGSGLAIMNNACKSSHHSWCAPIADVRHQTKTSRS